MQEDRTLYGATIDGLKMGKLNEGINLLSVSGIMSIVITIGLVIHIYL